MVSLSKFFRAFKTALETPDDAGQAVKAPKKKARRGSFKGVVRSASAGPAGKSFKAPSADDVRRSTLLLFRAVPIKGKRRAAPPPAIMKRAIRNGYAFSPLVSGNYSRAGLGRIAAMAEKELGLNPEEMNSSFHKSWRKVRDTPIEKLFFEQITHYFTTYGYARLGIYSEESVFIPREKLEIPGLEAKGVRVTIIRGYTKAQLTEKVLKLLESGAALKGDTVKDALNVCAFVKITKKDAARVRNREGKAVLYDYFGVVPEEPVEFLRYLVYRTTGKTLLIKDRETLQTIRKEADPKLLTRLFVLYHKTHGLERLASVFLRFKPLFLAFRADDDLKTIVNRIRKLATTNHRPMGDDYLNSVTARLARGSRLDPEELSAALKRANTFRKARLAYALKYRTLGNSSIMYWIRNGKAYATKLHFQHRAEAKKAYGIVLDSIVKDIAPKVRGKKVYIPEGISYALPATEKKFTGAIPNGSCVSVPKDLVLGVHWKNVGGLRVDLDLSLLGAAQKIGWDARYRDETGKILFSGDMTDASGDGATELFHLKRQEKDAHLLFLNYFNFAQGRVPFKLLVAQDEAKSFGRNYMVDPNKVACVAESSTQEKQKLLGLLVTSPRGSRFYFGESYLGNKITSGLKPYSADARRYLLDFFTNSITLGEVLEKAGAKLAKKQAGCDIDLSPEALEKGTILSLLS